MTVIINEMFSEVITDAEAPLTGIREDGSNSPDPHLIMSIISRAERRQMRLQAD